MSLFIYDLRCGAYSDEISLDGCYLDIIYDRGLELSLF